MIPLSDNVRAKRLPWVTWLLIAANARVFLHELTLGAAGLQAFIIRWGLVPAVWGRLGAGVGLQHKLEPILTSMFLHGGWLHFLGNMWFLQLFGRGVEDRLGPLRYAGLYLASGAAAALLQLFALPGSLAPTIGASGAIAGVMGAYFILLPRARVRALVPLFFIFFKVIEIPALFFLAFWFFLQLYSGAYSLGASFSGVAWWAHVGGFVGGIFLLRLLQAPRRAAA